ncbi:MAG TPA: DUF2256 domain-containing protein [Myxococcales bacterium]|nr:hypothetical protein [Myxococcales bacterium]HAN30798.1 DUF2256 domain-containing protein [Myxococcales bacterium]
MHQVEVSRRPHHRPHKNCPACGRPFSWRKKWSRCWNEVKWCSERCRRRGRSKPTQNSARREA